MPAMYKTASYAVTLAIILLGILSKTLMQPAWRESVVTLLTYTHLKDVFLSERVTESPSPQVRILSYDPFIAYITDFVTPSERLQLKQLA